MKGFQKAWVLTFVIIGFIVSTFGNDNCIFEHLSTESGLPHGSVSAMIKDKQGYMWFSTWDGVCRYDGSSFKTFKRIKLANGKYISNRISKIIEDSLGNIWTQTYDNEVLRFNYLTEKMEPVIEIEPNGQQTNITGVYPFNSGEVWLQSNNNGVYRVISNKSTNNFRVEHYNVENHCLPGNTVFLITHDNNNNIWVNTNQGLCKLVIKDNQTAYLLANFSKNTSQLINSLEITSSVNSGSSLYFGTRQGVLVVVNQEYDQANTINFGNDMAINDIALGLNNSIYLGTNGNGIYEYNEWEGKITRHFKNTEIMVVLKSFIDARNNLWIESLKAGISKINLNNGQFKHYTQKLDVPPDLRNQAQCGLLVDENQTLWLTLKGGGFGYYNVTTDKIEYFNNEPGNPKSRISNFVNCFYKDADGVLWLSTYFKGIEKITFNENQFDFNQPAPQYNLSISNEVRSILEDTKQLTWVGTKKREVYILDKNFKVIKKFSKLNGESVGLVYAIHEDRDGTIYLGTKGNGLFVLKRSGLLSFSTEHYTHNPDQPYSISNNNIYSLLTDNQGRLWVGTFGGGLNLFADGKFLHHENGAINYPAVQGQKVRHIATDAIGNYWIGTTDGLFFVKPMGKDPTNIIFNYYSRELGNTGDLRSNDIFWILCDKRQRIWVASLGGGLARLKTYPKPDSNLDFEVLTKQEGLSSDVIFTLIDDQSGNLWMSTENGISMYQPENKAFKNFSVADGIMNSTFSEASVTLHSDGKISFGANKGFYSFKPEGFKLKQQKVNLVFTGFQLFGNEVEPIKNGILEHCINKTSSLTLKHNQNAFGISWAGLNYKMYNKIQYAYRLKGFDADWQLTRRQNKVSYNKIPPGEYVFEVKFLNRELQELNEPRKIQITIRPPLWKTNWAYLSYFVLLILFFEITRRISISFIRLRNKVVIEKKLTEIKLNFFTNISHELRTPLTLISGPAKALKEQSEPESNQYKYAHLIEQNAQRLVRMVTHLLDFRKIQSNKLKLNLKPVDFVLLVNKVSQYFNEFAIEKNIKFKVSCPTNSIEVVMDEDKMESIIFNLLSNAFKFTPSGGKVWLSLSESVNKSMVTLEVKDSGPGVHKDIEENLFTIFASHNHNADRKHAGTGIGLALAKELVHLHNGTLLYRKAIKGGAVFNVELPVNNTDLHGEPIHQINLENEKDKKSQTEDAEQVIKNRKPGILVVEDNQELRVFLQMQLNDKYQVYQAANGQEGLKLAIKKQPDIILSDVMMPVMDGIEMLDKIKNNFEISHIPVVLLTSKSSVASKVEALKYGADAYITKPFSTEQLLAQVVNLLQQRSLLIEKFAGNQTEPDNTSDTGITDKDNQFLKQIHEIIEQNISNTDFKVEFLFKTLGMGRSNFFSKLKSLTGSSPIEFIKTYRLTKANNLLQTGNYNVSETAYLSGFTDAGYFSKQYKERYGISPSEIVKSKSN